MPTTNPVSPPPDAALTLTLALALSTVTGWLRWIASAPPSNGRQRLTVWWLGCDADGVEHLHRTEVEMIDAPRGYDLGWIGGDELPADVRDVMEADLSAELDAGDRALYHRDTYRGGDDLDVAVSEYEVERTRAAWERANALVVRLEAERDARDARVGGVS